MMTAGITFTLIVLAAASTGAAFKPDQWYFQLRKPSWTPAPMVFPIVWTVLYVAIAVAGWLVWKKAGWSAALFAWVLQIVLNAAWSWVFFGLRRVGLAFVDVIALVAAVVAFIVLAQPISSTAALLFVPYLAWVCTAAALNLRVLQLNPSVWRGGWVERAFTGGTATASKRRADATRRRV